MVQQLQTLSPIIDYPETDDQPMTESDATRNYLIYCVAALRLFFQGRSQTYVSGNLFIYYEEGHSNKNISPDVFVIFGVSKRERRSYKAWQENGKLPSFILELTSKSTKKQDEEIKPELYRQLGVQEYFQYDPTGDYLRPQLKGQTLVNGEYQPIVTQALPGGTLCLSSRVLGLDLHLLPSNVTSLMPSPIGPLMRELRFVDPSTGAPLQTYPELDQSRIQAEQDAGDARHQLEQEQLRVEQEKIRADEAELQVEQEKIRADEAELRAEQLAEKLRALGIDPNR
jgi:Uma2 family endonuclease